MFLFRYSFISSCFFLGRVSDAIRVVILPQLYRVPPRTGLVLLLVHLHLRNLHLHPSTTHALTSNPHRLRPILNQNPLLPPILHMPLGPHRRPPTGRRLALPQVRRILPPARLVRPFDVVARPALCSDGQCELWGVADGVSEGD